MNQVLSIGEVVADVLLHADTPLAVTYRKRVAIDKVTVDRPYKAAASVELSKSDMA